MIFTYPKLPEGLDVSRETIERLRQYQDLVARWNQSINLVSSASLGEAWHRHICDSAQIWPLVTLKEGIWLDIGSGGGFPGLVAAILAAEQAPGIKFILAESDKRKCVFLREAGRQLGVLVEVRAERIEAIPPIGADILSARALSGLDGLLRHAKQHLKHSGLCLFLKGQGWAEELEVARQRWTFEWNSLPSQTEPTGTILRLWDLNHA